MDVQALVDAMDDYAAPPAETATLPESYADLLEVIGSQWTGV